MTRLFLSDLRGGGETATPSSNKVTVLIVEDEGIVALDIQDRLVRLGYGVCSRAVSGQEAIEQALAHRPDLILMDIRLQGPMDGIQAANQIRSFLSIPIIYLTAYADRETLQRAKITEPHGYLIKPFEERELFIAIEMAMHKYTMERRVQHQAQQLEQIVNSVPEGVLLLDGSRHILLANPNARRSLMLLFNACLLEGDANSIDGSFLAQILETPDVFHEVKIDGRPPHVFEIMGRKVGSQSSVTDAQWLLIIRDVTREREQAARSRHQAHLAALGRLAAGIAHDFNNILGIMSTADQIVLMTQPHLTPRNREILTMNLEQVRRGSTLVKQMLDFSRSSATEPMPLDLVPLLKEMVKSLPHMLPNDISLIINYQPSPHIVNANPASMQQVIMNLVTNARDAMPNGGVLGINLERLSFTHEEAAPLPEMQPGEWIHLSVTDTGEGIAANILPHVFEPFFTTKPFGQGTGLGLAQVYGIVHQLNGHTDVKSRPGQQTEFDVYLPAVTYRSADDALEAEREHNWMGNGEVILLVEDEPQLRENVRAVLELFNYQVLDAANGRQALELWQEAAEPISLILSDVVMPEMGGVELCRTIKARNPSIPIIMMTGYSSTEASTDLAELGIHECLQKPVDIEQLAQVIARMLRL
jgi:two-component system, cell cycle sensor histidine kinase and response regulator CckA